MKPMWWAWLTGHHLRGLSDTMLGSFGLLETPITGPYRPSRKFLIGNSDTGAKSDMLHGFQ